MRSQYNKKSNFWKRKIFFFVKSAKHFFMWCSVSLWLAKLKSTLNKLSFDTLGSFWCQIEHHQSIIQTKPSGCVVVLHTSLLVLQSVHKHLQWILCERNTEPRINYAYMRSWKKRKPYYASVIFQILINCYGDFCHRLKVPVEALFASLWIY